MKTFQIDGYPQETSWRQGHPREITEGPTLIVAAQSEEIARAKALQILRSRGCEVETDALSVTLQQYPVRQRYP